MSHTAAAGKTCFIAMPITTTSAHAELFGDDEHWHHVMESLFVPAVEAAGFEVWRPVAKGSHLIHAEIVRQLEQADMVLCDLSQNNPNVFFELGVRTSVNRPIALVRSDDETPIPFDVSGINTHTYNPSLRAWSIMPEIEKLTLHLREAELSCAGENPLWRQFGMVLKAQEPTSEDSREEAILTLVTQQIGQLAQRVDSMSQHIQLSGPRTGREAGIWLNQVNMFVKRVMNLAEEYGEMIDVQMDHPNSGVLIKFLQPLGPETQGFRQRVRREASELNLPVSFQSAPETPQYAQTPRDE